jgi:hypothetical protein
MQKKDTPQVSHQFCFEDPQFVPDGPMVFDTAEGYTPQLVYQTRTLLPSCPAVYSKNAQELSYFVHIFFFYKASLPERWI